MYKYAFRCKFQTLIKHYYTCEKNGFLIFYVLKQTGGAIYVKCLHESFSTHLLERY